MPVIFIKGPTLRYMGKALWHTRLGIITEGMVVVVSVRTETPFHT